VPQQSVPPPAVPLKSTEGFVDDDFRRRGKGATATVRLEVLGMVGSTFSEKTLERSILLNDSRPHEADYIVGKYLFTDKTLDRSKIDIDKIAEKLTRINPRDIIKWGEIRDILAKRKAWEDVKEPDSEAATTVSAGTGIFPEPDKIYPVSSIVQTW
jgi:hypothetical protein